MGEKVGEKKGKGSADMMKSMMEGIMKKPEVMESMMRSMMSDPEMSESMVPMMRSIMDNPEMRELTRPMMQSMMGEMTGDTDMMRSRIEEVMKDPNMDITETMMPMMETMMITLKSTMEEMINEADTRQSMISMLESMTPTLESMEDVIRSMISMAESAASDVEEPKSMMTPEEYPKELQPKTEMTEVIEAQDEMMGAMMEVMQPMMMGMMESIILPRLDDPEYRKIFEKWVKDGDKVVLIKFEDAEPMSMRFHKDPEIGVEIEEDESKDPDVVLETYFGEGSDMPRFTMKGFMKDFITRKIRKKDIDDLMAFGKLIIPDFEMGYEGKSTYVVMKLVS
jgi:hypothetical protein